MGDLGEDKADRVGCAQRLTPASVKSLPGYTRLLRLLGSVQRYFISHYWVRIVMNRETRKLVQNVQPSQVNVLEISGDYWRHLEPFKSYRSVHYPEFDICASALTEQFDLIIAEQVFEHLLWPYHAGKHVYQCSVPAATF